MSSHKFSLIFCSKLGEEQKKSSSLKFSPIICLKLRAGLKQTYKTYPLCDQSFCPTYKGGAMPQFCILFYANYTILATQRGAMAHCPFPLNTLLHVVKKLQQVSNFFAAQLAATKN